MGLALVGHKDNCCEDRWRIMDKTRVDGWMDGWLAGWMGGVGGMDGRRDGWMDGRMDLP